MNAFFTSLGRVDAMTSIWSIWLEPPPGGALAQRSGEFIKVQSARLKPHGASGPFAPHVTLVGGFECSLEEARKRTVQLAADLARIPVAPFMDVTKGERFHQCVYMRVEPNDQLATAHAIAAEAFEVKAGNGGGSPYMPHLSLVYGDLPESDKDACVAEAAAQLYGDVEVMGGWEATNISLWRTDVSDATCESWERVELVPLRKCSLVKWARFYEDYIKRTQSPDGSPRDSPRSARG